MAIQIPQVKRNAPQGAESVGRMEIQAPDAKPYLQNLQTVQKTLETGADLAFKFQKQAEDNNVKELATQYKMKLYGDGTEGDDVWTVNKFQRTPKEGQDFTPYYGNYNDYRQKLRTEILDSGVSDRVRSRVEQEINETDFYANRTVNIEYFKSNNIRDEKIHEATQNATLGIDLPEAIGEYNPKDPGTQVRLNTVVNKLVENQKQYLINSQKFQDGDPGLNAKLNEYEGAVGLMAAQDALVSRDVEKAKAIFEEYKPLIPANKSQGLVAQIAKVEEDNFINKELDKYGGVPEDSARAAIKANKDIPDNLKNELLERLGIKKARESAEKARISEAAKNTVLLELMKDRQNNVAIPGTVKELEVKYGKALAGMNASDQQQIYNFIGQRNKLGNYPKYLQIISAYERNDPAVKQWDINRFNAETGDLDPKQYNSALNYFRKKDQWSDNQADILRIVNSATRRMQTTVDKVGTQIYPLPAQERWDAFIRPWVVSQIEQMPKVMSQGQIETEAAKLKKQVYEKLSELQQKKATEADLFKFQRITQSATQPGATFANPTTDIVEKIKQNSNYKTAPGQ